MAAEQISSTASSAEQEDLGMLLRLPTPTEDNDLSVMRSRTDESAPIATVSDQVVPKVNSEPSQPAQL